MGCKNAFDGSIASFPHFIHQSSGSSPNSFFINKFITKSSIDMCDQQSCELDRQLNDDKIKMNQFIKRQTLEFICNKPFLFVIHDNLYDNIFFLGRYTKPNA